VKALVVRPDGFAGVLLAGPAVRAVATLASRVTVMCGPDGAPAARLLPHVDDVLVWDAPWEPPGPDGEGRLRRLREAGYDVALVLPPEAHDPLPTARLLRRARVARIGARLTGGQRAEGAGGSGHVGPGPARADGQAGPIDVGHRLPPDRPDAEAALDTAAAMGFAPRPGDDGRLRVVPAPDTTGLTGNGPYVVVHPGSSCDPDRCRETVALLADAGHRVVVTGGPGDRATTRFVADGTAVDLSGRTDPRRFAGVLRAADAAVTDSAGAALLTAATGTPVVALTDRPLPPKAPGVRLDPGGTTARDVRDAVRNILAQGA
jgi:ADP-heptose:LPS heptosyltransferase